MQNAECRNKRHTKLISDGYVLDNLVSRSFSDGYVHNNYIYFCILHYYFCIITGGDYVTYTIETLKSKIDDDNKNKNGYEVDVIMAAYALASEAHEGQMRRSGEPFISHPLAVACILVDLNMDTETVVAALLHDVVEDCNVPLKNLKRQFGPTVAKLVDGVTKIGMVPLDTSKEDEHAINIQKILLAMAEDVRVMLIKIADRLHNMRTLEYSPPHKQRENALETMNFYAPLAHQLGMNTLKVEMEDLSLKYLDPYGFEEISAMITKRKEECDFSIERVKKFIYEKIKDINPIIEGRVKSVYSIYKKHYTGNKPLDAIFDFYAVRIIVNTSTECYYTLGIIHEMYRPLPDRFKDYIGTPKPNRYQSLHNTVMGKDGVPFEVQIRTKDMHNIAEYGIAAHWKYKMNVEFKVGRSGKKSQTAHDNKLEFLRNILDQQQEADDIQQLAEAIKTDLSSDDVYAFTPRGDVITLPLGSTIIDFAYAIHSAIGNKMTHAKIGGSVVSFDTVLSTGDVVEIQTTNSSVYGPNRNWLTIAKTNQAKSKIRAWFKKQSRPENIKLGKALIEGGFKRNSIPLEDALLKQTAKAFRFEKLDDFYASAGYGGISIAKILMRAKELYLESQETRPAADIAENIVTHVAKKQARGVLVDGEENIQVRFAQCCTPLPGDEIIGFETRGFGTSVHKKSCANVKLDKEPDRWHKVEWVASDDMYYRAAVEIIAESNAALADISTVITSNRLQFSEMSMKTLPNGNACINGSVEIANVEQLASILQKLKKIPEVISADRRAD
ncbi:MAG: bifunctional (p)ppGpp synthetase/guanosine-3',5'-bis(diphosphate) 3'-pyrophosphohydrolase [Oscillospiraceae bacterium]|nr:bifunctional (p)ppGpp synthetase/guanosine-3',5'-bis(diphosphate) 3'-pyrophosphohydrolase [Oscillospiraceae bacterium]